MKTNKKQLRPGSKLSRISFMTVKQMDMNGCEVENEDGFKWWISKNIVEEECYSVDFTDTQKVSKTALAELLMGARDAIVMVQFNKQPTPKTIREQLSSLAMMPVLSANKELGKLLKGESRNMIGYVVGSEPVLGRTMMIDLELPKDIQLTADGEYDNRLRQVDHRTLNWVVYKNVKYVCK
jgi:hypothetical protein